MTPPTPPPLPAHNGDTWGKEPGSALEKRGGSTAWPGRHLRGFRSGSGHTHGHCGSWQQSAEPHLSSSAGQQQVEVEGERRRLPIEAADWGLCGLELLFM